MVLIIQVDTIGMFPGENALRPQRESIKPPAKTVRIFYSYPSDCRKTYSQTRYFIDLSQNGTYIACLIVLRYCKQR